MRKLQFVFGLLVALISMSSVQGRYDPVSTTKRSIFATSKKTTPIQKALLTQRGYIQFLRWELPVPEIEEFTFCLWVKSTNLTYTHSIFSYSKDERDRFARSWISPFGKSVHLEIGGIEILAHPTLIEEHRWYHICQSWGNEQGHYALWIDGEIQSEGYSKQLTGHVIPSNGDIVLGQEYTDFDKGLEEGIEGAVLGFNLVLASAFDPSSNDYPEIQRIRKVPRFLIHDVKTPSPESVVRSAPEFPFQVSTSPEIQLRRNDEEASELVDVKPQKGIDLGTYPVEGRILNSNRGSSGFVGQRIRFSTFSPISQKIREDYSNFQGSLNPSGPLDFTEKPANILNPGDVVFNENYASIKGVPDPFVASASLLNAQTDPLYQVRNPKVNVFLKYPPKIMDDKREGVFESTLREYLSNQESIDRNLQKRGAPEGDSGKQVISVKITHKSKRDLAASMNDESLIEEPKRVKRVKRQEKPLGLQLIELSYGHCEIGRGSPFIGGSRMLISWARTPVRVFGGAIIKNAKSDCGRF